MSTALTDGSQKYCVPMVTKTLALLEAFRLNGARLSLAEAIELSGIPKASAFRMLETLRSSGYLTKVGNGRYRLTYKFFEMSIVVHHVNPIRRAALPQLKQLQEKTAETISFGVLQEDHVVYLEVLEGTAGCRRVPSPGSVGALHATAMGKALAAWLPEDQLDRILGQGLRRFTSKTIVTKAGLRAELARIREIGHATDIEEETIGCVGAAARICDDNGRASYAIGISGPSNRVVPTKMPRLAEAIHEACQQVRQACGFGRDACRISGVPARMGELGHLKAAGVR